MTPGRRIPRKTALLLGAPLLLATLVAGCGDRSGGRSASADSAPAPAGDSALAKRAQQLQSQFYSLQQKIRTVQAQALDSPGVKVAQGVFLRALRQRMVEIEPKADHWLDRARELGQQLSSARGDTSMSDASKQQLTVNLRSLQHAMEPVQDSAMKDSAVFASFRALRDSVRGTMVRIDPDARDVLDRLDKLQEQIVDVRRRQQAARKTTADSGAAGADSAD